MNAQNPLFLWSGVVWRVLTLQDAAFLQALGLFPKVPIARLKKPRAPKHRAPAAEKRLEHSRALWGLG